MGDVAFQRKGWFEASFGWSEVYFVVVGPCANQRDEGFSMGGPASLAHLVRRDARFYTAVSGAAIAGGGEAGRTFGLKHVFMDLTPCPFVSCHLEYK